MAGFTIPNAIQRMDVAGRDATEYLQLLLRKAGYTRIGLLFAQTTVAQLLTAVLGAAAAGTLSTHQQSLKQSRPSRSSGSVRVATSAFPPIVTRAFLGSCSCRVAFDLDKEVKDLDGEVTR
jgi:hypothetical protein